MVPCLHQCRVYTKRKLRVWRAQKCNFLVSAKTTPTRTGQQNTPCLAAPYWTSNRNFQNFGATFATRPCLHQCKVYIKRKLRVWKVQKFNFLVRAKTELAVLGQQTTPYHVAPYRASNENFRNFGDTFHHGTVFTPMQSLY